MTTKTITPPAPFRIAWPATIWIGAFHLLALLAFVPAFFSWQALVVCLFMHWLLGGVGICLTYHRLLTHRSFVTRPKAFEYFLVMIGCAASEGGPAGWVADHRRHHAHSDEPQDVHTPHDGFFWSHMGWWMTPDPDTKHTPEYFDRWVPDIARDPVLMFLEKIHFIFPLLTAGILFAIGGMPFLVWGSFVSTVLVLHSTWFVNSATHVWGYKTHPTRDDSTNLWWVAVLTYGEGWHNNHHAYQTSARHGLRWWEVDMTYIAIKLMSFVGLTHSLKIAKVVAKDAPEAPAVKSEAKGLRTKNKTQRSDEETELVGAVN